MTSREHRNTDGHNPTKSAQKFILRQVYSQVVGDPNASANEIRDADISSTGKAVVAVESLSSLKQAFWGSRHAGAHSAKEPQERGTRGRGGWGAQATDHRNAGLQDLRSAS